MTTIAITGAGGFLGKAVVTTSLEAGADVVAVMRSRSVSEPSPGVEVRRADLRDPRDVEGLLDGVDVLVHLAAAKSGAFHDQYPSTVKATEVVLEEAQRSRVSRVVLVSSFAVFDYDAMPAGAVVDEDAPLAIDAAGRDGYAEAKVLQEVVARGWAERTGMDLVVARPGVVYGPGSWWTYRIGEQFGSLWLCLGSRSQVPLSYVANCADAIVHLATTPGVAGGTFNVLDDDPPTQRDLRRTLGARLPSKTLRVVVPWRVAASGVAAIGFVNRRRDPPLRLPGFLVSESLAVRAKPFKFTNARLRNSGWAPRIPLADGLVQAVGPA